MCSLCNTVITTRILYWERKCILFNLVKIFVTMTVLGNLPLNLNGDINYAAFFMQMIVHIHPWFRRLKWNRRQNQRLWFLSFGHWWIVLRKDIKNLPEVCECLFPWRKCFIVMAEGSMPMTVHQSYIIHKHSGLHRIFQTHFSMCFVLEAKNWEIHFSKHILT